MTKKITYAESQGAKPFNWSRFLYRAQDGFVDAAEISRAQERAQGWVTCACGNQCAIIPRFKESATRIFGEPKDRLLNYLGIKFNDAIWASDWWEAKDVLKLIELRSAELLREMEAGK